jgi:glycosyltransferase involved in cell wall biosynthesis
MKVFGISLVRNEVDIIRTNILYHLALGIDQFLIVDNGSSDGTDQVLKQLGRDRRVRWSRDDGPYYQSQITSDLAREALHGGADWVVPIDADEFWYPPRGDFRRVLEASRAGALGAQVINFIQRRSQEESTPGALLHMTRRSAAPPAWPPKRGQSLVESQQIEAQQISFVEKTYPPKWIGRPTEAIVIKAGNHRIDGADGPNEITDELICLHAPLRSRAVLEARIGWASRLDEAGFSPRQSRHMRRWAKLKDDSAIELEWAANSYEDDSLDVYGKQHPVTFDPRLRDAVAPFVAQPL